MHSFIPPSFHFRGLIKLSFASLCLLFPQTAHAGLDLTFTVNMSEPVIVDTTGGVPRIAVDVDGVTRYGTYISGSGSSALTFTLTAQMGDLDLDGVTVSSPLDLNGGSIKDSAGNNATLTFTSPTTSGVKVDAPSLSMNFVDGANGRYTLNGTAYTNFSSFLTAAGGTFTRNSIATYYDSTGVMRTASANQPRLDHDPITHQPKGLLNEPIRTNLLTRSAEFDNAAWLTNTRATITANAATAPDGSSTAELLTEDATPTQTHGVYTNMVTAITAGQFMTYSVYVKNASGSRQLNLQLVNTGGAWGVGPAAYFNLSTGTASNVTAGSTASMTNVGNGWYRCILTSPAATTTVASTGAKQVYLATGNSQTYSGDGTSGLYIWGAQAEISNFATSYIPTTNTTMQRREDVLNIPTGSWYNQNAGSFYSQSSWESYAGVEYPMLFRFDDTTNGNRWNLFYAQIYNSTGIDGYAGGSGHGSFLHPSSINGSIKAASAQTTNSANAAFDGTLKTLKTIWVPPPVTQLVFNGTYAVKWTHNTKYYPRRVTDTQLQLLTQ